MEGLYDNPSPPSLPLVYPSFEQSQKLYYIIREGKILVCISFLLTRVIENLMGGLMTPPLPPPPPPACIQSFERSQK